MGSYEVYDFGNVKIQRRKDHRYLEIEIEETYGDLPPIRAKGSIRFFAEHDYSVKESIDTLNTLKKIIEEAEKELHEHINQRYFQCKNCKEWKPKRAWDNVGPDKELQKLYDLGICSDKCKKGHDSIN